jgi:hypothetical protein
MDVERIKGLLGKELQGSKFFTIWTSPGLVATCKFTALKRSPFELIVMFLIDNVSESTRLPSTPSPAACSLF